jgi:hypothetical protein
LNAANRVAVSGTSTAPAIIAAAAHSLHNEAAQQIAASPLPSTQNVVAQSLAAASLVDQQRVVNSAAAAAEATMAHTLPASSRSTARVSGKNKCSSCQLQGKHCARHHTGYCRLLNPSSIALT